MNIEECILSIAKGNIDALEYLYSEMRVSIYGYVLSIVCDLKLAEDITQDVFIHIYNKAPLYQAGMNPRGWIITITRNLAYDTLRKIKKVIFTGYESELENTAGIDSESTNLERIDLIAALMKLSKEERQIVILKTVSGFTHSEIAKELSLPEGTVKWKYRRSLAALADIIGGEEYGT